MNHALAVSLLGQCMRLDCTKPRARNPRTCALHSYCSLHCSQIDKLGLHPDCECLTIMDVLKITNRCWNFTRILRSKMIFILMLNPSFLHWVTEKNLWLTSSENSSVTTSQNKTWKKLSTNVTSTAFNTYAPPHPPTAFSKSYFFHRFRLD